MTLIQYVAIDKVLQAYKLESYFLVGLGVDGCSTILSDKKGLARRLKETSPNLVSFHCPAHRFQLGIRDISKDVQILFD